MVEKQPLTEETLAAKPGRRFPSLPPLLIGVFTGPSDGNVRDKGEYLECLFACQFPECFSNLSPHHSDAFVSLFYLCLGTNRGEGPEVGQHSVLAFPWLSLCPTGWKPDCYFSLAPQISSAAVQSWEVFSGLWGLKQAGT